MSADMESPPVENEIIVTPPAMTGDSLSITSPVPVAPKADNNQAGIDRPNPAERTDIVGVEEVAVPHLGALIAFVAAILFLINFLPIIVH